MQNPTSSRPEALLPAYAEWLERVEMTRESIGYCCFHRLNRDRALAERVSVGVVAGLLARPLVFQYFGLPFSGRVAHLAEQGIARAAQGMRDQVCAWEVLRGELLTLAPQEQEVVVYACVEGYDDPELAAALHCDEESARRRRDEVVERLRRCAEPALPPTSPQRRSRAPRPRAPPDRRCSHPDR